MKIAQLWLQLDFEHAPKNANGFPLSHESHVHPAGMHEPPTLAIRHTTFTVLPSFHHFQCVREMKIAFPFSV